MNDIHHTSDKFHAILYADDSNLVSTLCSFKTSISTKTCNKTELSKNINKELACIYEWLAINKLSLNISKTKFMIFHYYQRRIGHLIPEIKINNILIQQVSDFNFLGLTIDENFTWNPHIQKIAARISRSLGVMSRLKNILPLPILRLLYNSLILPHLQYAILTWGHRCKHIVKLQKKAIRTITRSKYNAHTEPLFKQLNLLKVEDIFKVNILRMYYKCCNNTIPMYFRGMFPAQSTRHTHNTRAGSNPIMHHFNTAGGRYSIRHFVPELLRQTPSCIIDKIETHSLQGVARYAKTYYLSQYKAVCNIPNCYICHRV